METYNLSSNNVLLFYFHLHYFATGNTVVYKQFKSIAEWKAAGIQYKKPISRKQGQEWYPQEHYLT